MKIYAEYGKKMVYSFIQKKIMTASIMSTRKNYSNKILEKIEQNTNGWKVNYQSKLSNFFPDFVWSISKSLY